MNSNFYEILTSVNTCWLIRLPKQLADIEQAFEELKETLKANQLNHPEAFKAYCLAALDQIDAEYKRLDAEYYDNIEYDFPKYEFYLSQILSTTFEALQLIIEYLGTYSPEVFTDYKIDLLCEYLPDSHPIRRKIMEGLMIKNQQLRAARLEAESTTTDQQPKTTKPEPESTTTEQQKENTTLQDEIMEIFETFFADWTKVFKKESDYKHLLNSLALYFEGGTPKLKKIATKPRVKTKLGMFFREVFNSNADSGQQKKGNKEFEALIRQIDCFENLSEYDLNKCITRSY